MLKAFRFSPILKQPLWSGSDIVRIKQLKGIERVGESWEISAFEGDETRVIDDSQHEGWTLRELAQCYKTAFMGAKNWERFGEEFPMLIKFLSSAHDLSIQVHPDDDMAQRENGDRYGKTEMWYVVAAQPNAKLVCGFKENLTPERYDALLAAGELPSVLATYDVVAGDVFSLPAGQIHSIGAGNFIIEVQQTSDRTFRVYDFDRRDAQGHKRELHSEQARRALDFTERICRREIAQRPQNTRIPLETHALFTVNLFHIDLAGTEKKTFRIDYALLDSFVAHIAFEGAAYVTDNLGTETTLKAGETLLFPAAAQWVDITPIDGATYSFIETYID